MIQCDSLVKIYEMEQHKVMALEGLDLTIEDGEMMAIIGKSGSGKSTLLNIIGGLESPTAGILMVDGKDLSSYTEKELVLYRRDKVGFVWQKSARNLFSYLTALENIEAPMQFHPGTSAREKRKRARDLLKAVGMEAHADKFPSQLSGGEQQRVSIARAIVKNPSILLCDEPTGALDSKNSLAVVKLLLDVRDQIGCPVVTITHNAEMAKVADRVFYMKDGQMIRVEKNEHPLKAEELLW